jgi:hypothetical protein
MAATILSSVQQHGGRVSRYGEFTMVFMHGGGFITTPMEYMQMQNWARGRVSSGSPVRDRTTFVDRFETMIGRVGSGISSKGSRGVLLRIVKAMKANAVFLEEWNVPRDLDAGMEMKKPKPDDDDDLGAPLLRGGTYAAVPSAVASAKPK